jgi:hypothetical protein
MYGTRITSFHHLQLLLFRFGLLLTKLFCALFSEPTIRQSAAASSAIRCTTMVNSVSILYRNDEHQAAVTVTTPQPSSLVIHHC